LPMKTLSKPRKPSLARPLRLSSSRAIIHKQRGLAARFSQRQMIVDLRNYQRELEIQNKALRYSQTAAEGASERFLTLFSNVPLSLMVVDENSLVLESNAMALQFFRPLESDPPLNFLFPLVDEAHVDEVTNAFRAAKESGTSEITEVVFSCGSGGSFTGDLHIARLDNPFDELAHFICAVIDQGPLLTERRALQTSAAALQRGNQELQLSQNRLASVINSSLDAILCVDSEHRITIFNPAAAALFDCPPEDALGSPLDRFLPQLLDHLPLPNGETHAQLGEMTGCCTQGNSVAIDVSVSFERHLDGETTTIFARDLTAKKKMEAHRTALESQLRESQKMQAVGTMAGGIAHDFNNIIGAILGNVELAKQDAGADSPALVSLKEIDKAGRRARDLVRQILTFSRNESPKRIPTDLADVVHETVRLLKVALPPCVDLRVKIDPSTPPVLADATQIEQALINLCTNAIHAMTDFKGTITVELGHSLFTERPGIVERRSGARGRHVRLAVHDTGSGIAPETLRRVFEPFFTTKPVGQGTGLGLAVVHGIMRTHHGTVDVRSSPESGSVFTLYFPVSDMPVAPVAPPPPKREMIKGQGKHVMYVDDDEALVFLVERVLKRRGFRVSTFTDPRLACETLRKRPMDFDLLVTDYNMPGYSGVDLLREARLIRPDLPVALASGYITPEIEKSALKEGARALVHKPNDVDELCETVQRLLQASYAPV
jgi:two-component system, cell cycle sensor histidine kinase and response regulator CckA